MAITRLSSGCSSTGPTSTRREGFSAQGGRYGTALEAASGGGHDQIVQRLLKQGTTLTCREASAPGEDISARRCSRLEATTGASNRLKSVVQYSLNDITPR
jgi:hypothetical protein